VKKKRIRSVAHVSSCVSITRCAPQPQCVDSLSFVACRPASPPDRARSAAGPSNGSLAQPSQRSPYALPPTGARQHSLSPAATGAPKPRSPNTMVPNDAWAIGTWSEHTPNTALVAALVPPADGSGKCRPVVVAKENIGLGKARTPHGGSEQRRPSFLQQLRACVELKRARARVPC
jgi:hypothetical protein